MVNQDLIPENAEQASKLSEAEFIALELVSSAKTMNSDPRYIARTVRLRPTVIFLVEALAKQTGWTIQETFNRMLEAGADAIKAAVAAHDPERAANLYCLPSSQAEALRAESVAS